MQATCDPDGAVRLPFGRAVEEYLYSLPVSNGVRYKKKNRMRLNDAVKQGLIYLERVEGAIDYIAWETAHGQRKSTNRLDDILRLTESGRRRVEQIKAGNQKDIKVWKWLWFCPGEQRCLRRCGGIGACIERCDHHVARHKNPFDMHNCSVQIITEVMLSDVSSELPVRMTIKGSHVPSNVAQEAAQPSRLNLSREARDLAIMSRRADRNTTKEVKMKLLAPHNGASENELKQLYTNQHSVCDDVKLRQLLERDNYRTRQQAGAWTILHELVTGQLKERGFVLHYQQPEDNAPKDHSDHYYQLTVSDDLWLKQARDCGTFCFGVDGKYDLNNDAAPVLSLVVEDQAGYGSPIAFGLSNKENQYTIRIAVEALQQNIPCYDISCNHEYEYIELENGKGFRRVRKCAPSWQPFAMMDKHRPTKRALQPILRGVLLCWFHIMQTLGDHLQELRIDDQYRYAIAIAFKIVGRSRDEDEAKELGKGYETFIEALPLSDIAKDFLCNDIWANWLCREWVWSFIDGGRLPSPEDGPNAKPMTTNNLTERMNKSIEGRRVGIQPVNKFIEHLYGITSVRSSIIDNESASLTFQAGQITYWNSRIVEHQLQQPKLPADMKRRLNQGRIRVLLHYVRPTSEDVYFHIKKANSKFRSPYTMRPITIHYEVHNQLQKMLDKLASKHAVPQEDGCYLANIQTGECTCLDFAWNGSFRDICKHVHAARLYNEIEEDKTSLTEVKQKLVKHFKNKERAMPIEQKNAVIYSGSVEAAFDEILRAYSTEGDDIFYPCEHGTTEKDPFRPAEMPARRTLNIGAPKIHGAKPRKPSRFPGMEVPPIADEVVSCVEQSC